MGKKIKNLLNLVVWLTGVLVSLAVGFGMTGGTLTIAWLSDLGLGAVTVFAGWVVVITTLASVVLALLKQ